MSNKLKKHRNLKPDGYEERFAIQQYRKNYRLAENAFAEVFYSMQFINYSVLFMESEDGGFDFTKRKLENFAEVLRNNNQKVDKGELFWDIEEERIRKKFEFDCLEEAKRFPYRSKMKMYGRKVKNMQQHSIVLENINEGIEICLILMIYTLHENYRFSKKAIWKWWESCKKVAELYARGMTDQFIIEFLEKEVGIEIENEKQV